MNKLTSTWQQQQLLDLGDPTADLGMSCWTQRNLKWLSQPPMAWLMAQALMMLGEHLQDTTAQTLMLNGHNGSVLPVASQYHL